MNVMLKCGCVAHALKHMPDGSKVPSCVIHNCTEQVEAPNLEGRKARCHYYGKRTGRMNECNFEGSHGSICHCEQPSSLGGLAFFEYKPSQEFDSFYCGCHGWD